MLIKNILNKLKKYISDIIIIIVIIILFNMFFPHGFYSLPNLKKGDIAPKDIVAPFTFPIIKSEEVLEKERKEAADNVPPILIYDSEKTEKILKDFNELNLFIDSIVKSINSIQKRIELVSKQYPEFSQDLTKLLVSKKRIFVLNNTEDFMKELLSKGVIKDKSTVPYGKSKDVVIIKNNEKMVIKNSEFYDIEEAFNTIKDQIAKRFSSNSFLLKYGIELIRNFLRPNVFMDIEQTVKLREKTKSEVPEYTGMVLKGEIIVRAHDIVSKSAEEKLRSLKIKREEIKPGGIRSFLTFISKNFIFIIILILYFIFTNMHFNKLKIVLKDKIFVTILFIINLAILGLFYSYNNIYYLIPLLLSAGLLALLYSRTFATISIIFFSLALTVYSGLRLQGILMLMIASIYIIYMIREMEKRNQFLNIIFQVSIIAISMSFFTELYRETDIVQILIIMALTLANVVISIVFMIIFVPIMERVLGRLSRISLFELSDLNNHLLKEMAENASGTFNHSLMVSNLSESGARAINADYLLSRVGAYYHDVGKVLKPEYFIENQTPDFNPHESLPPELSAEIIREHVINGVDIAKKNNLPKQIIDFIKTHHGDSKIDFFYEKAKEKKKNVNEEKYRYPGPLPITKEQSIVMLADSIEAAVRSLKNKNEKNIAKMVNFIFDKKIKEEQLRDSNLSIKELNILKNEFLKILFSIYHSRVEYNYKNE